MNYNTISLFINAGIFVGVWSNFLYHIGSISRYSNNKIDMDADTHEDILK